MKVVTAFPIDHIEDATGKFIIEGFEALGHPVVCNIDERSRDKDNPAKALLEVCREKKPDIVLLTRSNLYDSVLKDVKNHVRYLAAMNVDARCHPSDWKELDTLIKGVDKFFIVEGGHEDEYQRIYGPKVHFNPTACSPKHKMLDKKKFSPEEINRYSAKVSFIGAVDAFHSKERKGVIDLLRKEFGSDFKVWGPGSKNGYAETKDFNAICALSDVVIGNNWIPSLDSYVSERDFRVLGCGGVLLTNLVKDSKKILGWPGVTHFKYESPSGCVDMALKLTKLQKERADYVRQQAFKFAHSECEFKHRMKFIIETLEA